MAENMLCGFAGDTYRMALLQLKQRFGRRNVMRVIRELDRLEFPKNDPVAFSRAAEIPRDHAITDVTERLCQKLQLQDHLAYTSPAHNF